MASFEHHLTSAVGMTEQALIDVTKWSAKYPKWADKVAHDLDDAIARATREIEYIEEEEIARLESTPDDLFWAL